MAYDGSDRSNCEWLRRRHTRLGLGRPRPTRCLWGHPDEGAERLDRLAHVVTVDGSALDPELPQPASSAATNAIATIRTIPPSHVGGAGAIPAGRA